jgi:LacI family transcriptional regulator
MLRKAVSQRLIAQKLNLSTATISKSLSNHPDINPATRARVLEFASQIGYRVTRLARAKAPDSPRQHRFVGVLFHGAPVSNATTLSGAGFLTGLSESAKARNVSLVVHRHSGEGTEILDPKHQPAAMAEGMLQGLVLVHGWEPDVVKQLATRWPVVTVVHYVPDARADHVDSDYVTTIARGTARMFELGHRKFGFYGKHPHLVYNQSRFGAFAMSMARLGIPIDNKAVVRVYKDSVDLDERLDSVISAIKRGTTGWVCTNDQMAFELIRGLASRGIKTPKDVSITGFDGEETPAGLPQLTTFRVPFVDIGAAALVRLLNRLERPSLPPRQILFDCPDVPGQTVGPAPKSAQ